MYHRPKTLDTALAVLADGPVCIAAGCTDLYPVTRARGLAGPVLDLTAVDGLRGIRKQRDEWRIGATTTWTDILKADLPCAFDGLKLAAREVGSIQIQNAGTLAGNLCTASPAGDGVPCLLTLDASVELTSIHGTRSLPVQDFLTGARQTALQPGELVTAILIPREAGRGQAHFQKLGARKYLIISIAMVAVRLVLKDGIVAKAALAVGACSPVARRLPVLEARLIAQPLELTPGLVTDDLIAPALSPIDDIRADAAYRVEAASVLLRRSLAALGDAAGERAA